MRTKFYVCACLMVSVMLLASLAKDVGASSLDKYRAILASQRFTITYKVLVYDIPDMRKPLVLPENIYFTPSEVQAREAEAERQKAKVESGGYQYPLNIFVNDGKDRYTEMQGRCKLIKNGEVFTFLHDYYMENKYIGTHVSKKGYTHQDEVAPGERIYNGKVGDKYKTQEEALDIENPMFVKMLAVIYPVSKINVVLPEYALVKSGYDEDGTPYEDYSGVADGRLHAVRCYFRNGEIVKMAYASFLNNVPNAKESYEKLVVQVEKFTDLPEEKYLSLPSELKVVRE